MTGVARFRVVRWVAYVVFGLFFLIPLYSMLDFSTRTVATGERTARAWVALVQDEVLRASIVTSLLLALFTRC